MKLPIYCPDCDEEIPDEEEISSIRDLLKQCGILLKEGDGERVREALETLRRVSVSHLYGEKCASFPPGQSENDDDPTTEMDKLFDGLVAQAGGEAQRQASRLSSQDENSSQVKSLRSPATELVRLGLLAYREHRVYEAPKSQNMGDQIPPWGLDSRSVLELLRYLDPYSEDRATKKKLLCMYDAISGRWWRRALPADSPLHEMDEANVDRLLIAIKDKGNEVLCYEPPPVESHWLLRSDAIEKIDHRFRGHVNSSFSRETRTQAIGYLAAPIPALRLVEEGPFIKIVKAVLVLQHPEIISGSNPFDDNNIRKAIQLIGLQHLKKISQISNIATRGYCFKNPSSLVIEPEEVASFVAKHADMQLTHYDEEIRVLLDGFEPEVLAAVWLQADVYIQKQIIDAFDRSVLYCPRCHLRLPNKEELRWIDLTREWLCQYLLEELYARNNPFCLCPEKDEESSADDRARWRRKRQRLVAAVALKYPNLDRYRTQAKEATSLLKILSDIPNGKRLPKEKESLKRRLRRFTNFGNKWLYHNKLPVPGHGEMCVADLIDTPWFSDSLRRPPYKAHWTALDELVTMRKLLGMYLGPSEAKVAFDSRYPTPRREYDPDEKVWACMGDDDFSGDPWAPDDEGDGAIDAEIDGGLPLEEYEQEEREAHELRVILKNGGGELEVMQELQNMDYYELKAKLREHLKERLKALGNRISFLLHSSSV